jgi:FkbM family methyltransferase
MATFREWTRETSPLALRAKQFIASVLPDPVLMGLKKRYYISQLRNDSDELMESDARALPRFVKPGDFVVDVGAFVGFYTRRLSSLVGPSGQVWSFEPMPATREILTAAVERLGLSNVRVFPYAVSDKDAAATMEIPRYTGGGESWWDSRIVQPHAPKYSDGPMREFQIDTRSLDSVLARNDRPIAFMKIDAEYHELPAIRGGLETFRRWHPVIQLETLDNLDDPATGGYAIIRMLADLGYSPYLFDGDSFRLREPGRTTQQNLFFLCDEHLRAVGLKP